MKIFILTILMGAILGSASYSTTLADTSVGVGFSASNFATDRGLAVRDDSLGYSLNLTAPAADGNLSIGLGLYDTDGSSEDTDFSIAYSKGIEVFGQKFGASASFSGFDSVFGDREEIAIGLTYKLALIDTSVSVWHDLDNEWYGVELGASTSIATPIKDLSVTPFITLNLADEYSAIEAGLKATYPISDKLSASAKASYNNNNFEGSSFEVNNEWIIGAGVGFKF
jgi:outer membrane usher protein FimD/PapC